MSLAFLNISPPEIVLIFLTLIVVVMGIGNYGRYTALGYRGSVLLTILTTPLVAFIVIGILRRRKAFPHESARV